MERIPKGIYTKELREEAVKLVTEGGPKIHWLVGIPFDLKSPAFQRSPVDDS